MDTQRNYTGTQSINKNSGEEEYKVYVLNCIRNLTYVGLTKHLKIRIHDHCYQGTRSEVTKVYTPIRIEVAYDLTCVKNEVGKAWEDLITLDLMLQRGYRNVRGGHFCDLDELTLTRRLKDWGYDFVLKYPNGGTSIEALGINIEKFISQSARLENETEVEENTKLA